MVEQQVQQQTSLELYEQELRDKAQTGDPVACFNLVDHFERKGKADNLLEAQYRTNFLMQASNQGLGAASILLATWYLNGHYVNKDIAKAILFFEHAASVGKSPMGYYRLAELFESGEYLPANVDKAEQYLQKAFKAGYPDAIFTVAVKQLETDQDKAFKLLQDNYVKHAHIRSLLILNDHPEFNQEKLVKLLAQYSTTESFAAALYAAKLFDHQQFDVIETPLAFAKTHNNPIAYYVAGLMALKLQNTEQAYQEMLVAAELGHIEAAYRVAVALSQQADEIEDEKAKHDVVQKMLGFFAKAAQNGFAPAQYSLAQCWLQGIGLEKNQQEALGWLERAAQQGHVDASFTLAMNLPMEHPQHLPLLQQAAQAGHSQAMLCVGMYLQYQNQAEQAMAWFEHAKQVGDLRADYLIALAYRDGVGVEADPKKAIDFLKLASDHGDTDAHFALYEAYRDGVGVRRNKKSQAKYLKLAQAQGHPEAQDIKE